MDRRHGNSREPTDEGHAVSDYYAQTYAKWYAWFSYVNDPFARLMLFVLNGGPGGERRLRGQVIDWIDPKPGEKILDICSGTGTLAIMLGKRLAGSGRIVGIEISGAQLRIARRKRCPEAVSFVEADARNIPFPNDHFDKAVIFGALHEMPRRARRKVLSEALRVLKPGGGIVVTEHNRPEAEWKARLFAFLERFNPEYPTYKDLLRCGLTSEISRTGFKILRVRTDAWDFFQTVLAKK